MRPFAISADDWIFAIRDPERPREFDVGININHKVKEQFVGLLADVYKALNDALEVSSQDLEDTSQSIELTSVIYLAHQTIRVEFPPVGKYFAL